MPMLLLSFLLLLAALMCCDGEVSIESNYALRIGPSQPEFPIRGQGFEGDELGVRFLPELTGSGYVAMQQGVDFDIIVINSTAALAILSPGDVWRFSPGSLKIFEVYDSASRVWRDVSTSGGDGLVTAGIRVAFVADDTASAYPNMLDDEGYLPGDAGSSSSSGSSSIGDSGSSSIGDSGSSSGDDDDYQEAYAAQTDWNHVDDGLYNDDQAQEDDAGYYYGQDQGGFDDIAPNNEENGGGDDDDDWNEESGEKKKNKKKKNKKQKKAKKGGKEKKSKKENDDDYDDDDKGEGEEGAALFNEQRGTFVVFGIVLGMSFVFCFALCTRKLCIHGSEYMRLSSRLNDDGNVEQAVGISLGQPMQHMATSPTGIGSGSSSNSSSSSSSGSSSNNNNSSGGARLVQAAAISIEMATRAAAAPALGNYASLPQAEVEEAEEETEGVGAGGGGGDDGGGRGGEEGERVEPVTAVAL